MPGKKVRSKRKFNTSGSEPVVPAKVSKKKLSLGMLLWIISFINFAWNNQFSEVYNLFHFGSVSYKQMLYHKIGFRIPVFTVSMSLLLNIVGMSIHFEMKVYGKYLICLF